MDKKSEGNVLISTFRTILKTIFKALTPSLEEMFVTSLQTEVLGNKVIEIDCMNYFIAYRT